MYHDDAIFSVDLKMPGKLKEIPDENHINKIYMLRVFESTIKHRQTRKDLIDKRQLFRISNVNKVNPISAVGSVCCLRGIAETTKDVEFTQIKPNKYIHSNLLPVLPWLQVLIVG